MTNRLANETSPYLLQHAHNPVDWYAWGDEAFAKARSEDKPVFLSIGYSACHWCHVMERESFEDDATADLLNREFVSIKVDREERPDIDAIYMQAVQLMTGQGGWPMSMFLTPDARPFYAGTYFPPDDSRGMPSFKRVLKHVYETYKSRRNDVTEAAEEVQRAVAASMRIAGEKRTVDRVALERAASRIAQGYDAVNGGFGSAPKFPPSMTLDFLMQVSWRSGDLSLLDMVTSTLIKMARGGIYDQIGGGFHRYSVDAKWLVPHFEKMLYDNALLARLYTRAWQMTKGALFARVAHEVLSFIKREMTSPEGGFYSTLDADSEGEEGKFYAWSRAEVVEALGEDDAKAVCALYDITDRGNWEGKNIPNMPRDPKAVADSLGITVEQLSELASRSKAKLYEVRERRIRPGRDEKILTGWNGWMLAAFAEAAAAFDRDEYRAIVRRNADFLIGRMTGDRIIRSGRIPGLLEDYAGAAWGLALAYEATHERRYLDRSRALAEQILTRFRDDAGGGFFDTPVDHEQLITRPKELFDNATPSGNSMTCEVLLRLALLFGEQRYADVATSTIDAIWAVAERYPSAFGFLLGTAEWREGQPKEIAISGPVDDERFRALRRIVGQTYLPHRVLVGGEASSDLPLLENRPHSKVVAYVCQAYACLEPTSDPDRLRVLIGAANAPGSAQPQGT